MELHFNSVNDNKPEPQVLCLLKMETPSKNITYVTGWYNPERYEWECNTEDTHYGGYLETPYKVIEWAYCR